MSSKSAPPGARYFAFLCKTSPCAPPLAPDQTLVSTRNYAGQPVRPCECATSRWRQLREPKCREPARRHPQGSRRDFVPTHQTQQPY